MKQKKINNNKNLFIIILSTFVIIIGVVIGFNLLDKTKVLDQTKLVGVWQDDPMMGSGWSNRYHFYNNGYYSFVTSEMKCDRTLEQIDGSWKIEDGKLILTKSLILERIDGKKIKSVGSCGTEYELVDYTSNIVEASEWCKTNKCTLTTTFDIPKIIQDGKQPYIHSKTNIDGVNYWKFYDDPDQDSPALIGGNTKADDYNKN